MWPPSRAPLGQQLRRLARRLGRARRDTQLDLQLTARRPRARATRSIAAWIAFRNAARTPACSSSRIARIVVPPGEVTISRSSTGCIFSSRRSFAVPNIVWTTSSVVILAGQSEQDPGLDHRLRQQREVRRARAGDRGDRVHVPLGHAHDAADVERARPRRARDARRRHARRRRARRRPRAPSRACSASPGAPARRARPARSIADGRDGGGDREHGLVRRRGSRRSRRAVRRSPAA